eukprot:COSAG02_NODE_9366_length_2240_cov_0.993461_2_plen_525_part_00
MFLPGRLPRLPGTNPELISFYEAQLGDEDEPALGQRWFDMCSNHAALEYLSPTTGDLAVAATSATQEGLTMETGACGSSGPGIIVGSRDSSVQYELLPTLQNVARTCGTLLGAEGASEWQKLADLADWWNALPAIESNSNSCPSPSARTRKKLAVVEEVRSFRAPHGEEMLHREHALLSLLPSASDSNTDSDSQKQGRKTDSSTDRPKRLSKGTGRSADPYDVSFPIRADAKQSEFVAAAAMESSGGIKLTLEEAHNISAVFHVPAPRPWLQRAQDIHLDNLVGQLHTDSCNGNFARKNPAANALLAAVLPALLGGRWLEVPTSGNVSLGVLSMLSARLTKGGELEAATAKAVYTAFAVSSSVHRGWEDEAQQQQQQLARAQHERALCLALARRMIAELALTEAAASGGKSGGRLLADTQLRLAKAVVAQATQASKAVATAAAGAASSTGPNVLLLEALSAPQHPHQLRQPLVTRTLFGADCTLLDAAVAGWVSGWHVKLFSALGWRDRLRLARFALEAGQRAP